MKLQVLISSLKKEPEVLIKQMHLETPAILVNQCDTNAYEELSLDGNKIAVYHFNERGVGLSRNNALLRATGDIVLFSDEDIVYDTGYAQMILEEFARQPKADMLVFNVRVSKERRTYYNTKEGRVRFYNCGRYPTYSFAVKREKLHQSGVTFSLLFGGGARYSAGEDSLFIMNCLRAGLKIYRSTKEIGEEIERPSTWFEGYTEKFFYDRGALYHHLYGKLAGLMSLRFILSKKSFMCTEVSPKRAYQLMCQGRRSNL